MGDDGGMMRSQLSHATRNAQIDIIRGVSILLVLFHHFNIAYRLNDTALTRIVGWDALRAVARNGNYGVTMFFVISGYLITSHAYQRWNGLSHIDAKAFYGLRIARVAPPLILLLALVNALAWAGVAIFQNHAPMGTPVSFWIVNLASLTFWMNVLIGAHGWVNYPLSVLWSLSVEEVFYLAFPLLCLALRRESRLLAVWAVFVVIGPWYRFTHQADEGQFLYGYFACFDGIAIGCCTALLARRWTLRGLARTLLRLGTVSAMTFLYLYWPISQSNVFGVSAMALGTTILLLTSRGGEATLPALQWFGRLSYEFYLFHLIVLGMLRTQLPPSAVSGDEKLVLLAVYLLLSALVSMAIARFYAEPLNRRIRRWLGPARRPLIDNAERIDT